MIPKFRACDKVINQMFIPDSIHFDSKGMVDGIGSKETIFGIEDFELMQSTGLRDVNGKEIFEGDIVKALSEGYCGTFQVVWRKEGTPMYILYPAWQNEQFWDLKGVNGVDDGIEVIGNIYEHPELLENI